MLDQFSRSNIQHNCEMRLGLIDQPDGFFNEATGSEAFGNDLEMLVGWFDVSRNQYVDGPLQLLGRFWDPSSQLYQVLAHLPLSTGGDSFTQNDRTLLTQINVATVINAYTPGLFHTGLTGNGELTLGLQTRAIRTRITALPVNVTPTLGLPPFFFNLGFITPRTTTSWARSSRLTFEEQLFVISDTTTSVSWTLLAGVAIEIEELLRQTV
jgi:hypothetical protein